jgi:hypothetical protein
VLGCRSTPACPRLLRTGRLARRGSWATPVRDRFGSLVMANSTFPAAIGLRRGGPVGQVQVDPAVVRRSDTRITSPKLFICHFAGQALLALI